MTNYTKIAYTCIAVYLTVCCFNDLTVKTSSEKEIPVTKVGLNENIGPTLNFFYCYSCGYKKAFEDYSTIIRQKYPEISITGGNHDPPTFHLFIARSMGFLKMIIILCVLFGVNIFNYLGIEQPSWWAWCTSNKIYSCLLIFFVSNAIEGHFISTGAFEITLNDIPVWSKLETGRIPQPPELFQIIDNHMRLDEPLELKSSGFPK